MNGVVDKRNRAGSDPSLFASTHAGPSPDGSTATTATRTSARSLLMAGMVLTACLALTVLAVQWERSSLAADDWDRFSKLTERLRGELVRRVIVYRHGLMGARSLFPASQFVERAEFRAMVEARDLQEEFPGATGIGYIKRVANNPKAVEDFLARTRADGASDFQIKIPPGASPMPGSVIDDRLIIEYIEPLEFNRNALGLDIGSHPVRREAAERAMLTGEGSITGCVQLVQERKKVAGFLYMLPVYRQGMPTTTPTERVAALEGWVYMPMLGPEVFRGAVAVADGELDVEVYDGPEPSPDNLIFDDDGHVRHPDQHASVGREFVTWQDLEIGGRQWRVAMSSTRRFEYASRMTVWMLGGAGTLLSILLGLLVYAQSNAVHRARAIAAGMTEDLRRMAMVAEHTTNAVLITDEAAAVVWTNKGFSRLTGLRLAETQGRLAVDVMLGGDADPATMQAIHNAFDAGTSYRGQVRGSTLRGNEFWVDANIEPIRDEHGELQGFVVVESDITVSRKAVEQVTNERSRLASFIEHAPAAVAMFDRDLRYLAASRRWMADYKLEGQTIIGKCHYDIFPNISDTWKQIHQRCLQGAVEQCDDDPWRPAGWDHDQHLQWEVRPWHQANGIIGGVVMFTQDVTEQHEAAERLRLAGERTELALAGGNLGLWDWNTSTGTPAPAL